MLLHSRRGRSDRSRCVRTDLVASHSTKPGSHFSRMLRKSPAATSWQSTPIDPMVTRWMSRYAGGRFSCRPSLLASVREFAHAPRLLLHPGPGEVEVAVHERLQQGPHVVEHALRVDLHVGPHEALGAQVG